MSQSKLEVIAGNLAEVAEKMQEAKRAASDQMKAALEPLFQALFEDVPKIKSVTWVQYTPYFNDGEECVFSAHDPEFANDTNPDFESYREDGELGEGVWSYGYGLDRAKELTNEEKAHVGVFLKAFYDIGDVPKDMFGDHMKVRYTSEGKFETQDYDHD